jgi:hypothetical protein
MSLISALRGRGGQLSAIDLGEMLTELAPAKATLTGLAAAADE